MPAQTAYVIMGHGSEIPKTKIKNIVPPGCTLVVEVHSGELNYLSDFDNIINYPNKSIFLDPINNYKEVVKAITNTQKTLAIYKEGDEYPDFQYGLLSSWTSKSSSHVNPNQIRLRDSGIMEYPFKSIKPNHIVPKNELYDINSPNLDIFADQFRNSIYPSKEVVKNFINNNKFNTLNDIMKSMQYISETNTVKLRTICNKYKWNKNQIISSSEYLKIINPEVYNPLNIKSIIEVKQSELFKKLPPGVFYNLVCRATSNNIRETAKVFIKNDYWYSVNREIIKNNVRLPIKTRKNTNQYFIPEIMGQISEAELQRKPYIKQTGLNTLDTTKLEQEIADIKINIHLLEERILLFTNKANYYNKQSNTITDIKKYKIFIDDLKKYKLFIDDIKKSLIEHKQSLDEKEKILKKMKLTLPQNMSLNNYIWEKQQNKWGKVTIKNRNNKGLLPTGWKIYSTNNQTWYKAPSGALQWTRPEITSKNRNNKGLLPTGWVLKSDGNASWYKGPSGALQWIRPNIEDPGNPSNNSNDQAQDPTEHKSNHIRSVSNNQGQLPYPWHHVKDGNKSWYETIAGQKQKNRPIKATRKKRFIWW